MGCKIIFAPQAIADLAAYEPGAVDRLLEQRGLLRRIADVREVDATARRSTPHGPPAKIRRHGRALVELFAEAVEAST